MFIFLLLSIFVAYAVYEMIWKRRKWPPGPMPLPLIGNVHQLDMQKPDVSLMKFKKQYGPIFTIFIPKPTVIVADYEVIKETFIKQSEIFSARPKSNLLKLAFGGTYGLIFGEPYKERRRFTLHVLRDFGFGRPMMQETVLEQAHLLCAEFLKHQGEPFDVNFSLAVAVGNIIHRLIFGFTKSFDDSQFLHLRETFENLNKHVSNSKFLLLELYPWLHQLNRVGIDFGGMDAFKKDLEKICQYVRQEIKVHRDSLDGSQPPRDYIDAFLMEESKDNTGDFFELQLIAAAKDLFDAGTGTVVTTLRFALKAFLEHPEIQEKLQEEIDGEIGRDREITMNDQQKLPYMNAFLQEIFRSSNILPMNLMHATTQDVNVGGYHLEKGTSIVLQMASIHMDEKEFPDPEQFRPSRFLDSRGQFVRDERVMPFSAGKRSCLGESLARMELFIFLATFVQNLRFTTENGHLSPIIGIRTGLMRMPEPFNCRVSAR